MVSAMVMNTTVIWILRGLAAYPRFAVCKDQKTLVP
jgi:hypothetical protein